VQSVAGVEPGAAHLGQVPAGPEIARAPLGVGFKAAAGQHHRLGGDFVGDAADAGAHPLDPVVVGDQVQRPGLEGEGDALAARHRIERLDQARPAAPGLDRQPAPEFEPPVDAIGLPPPDRHEAHAGIAHPQHRRPAAVDQQVAQLRIGAVFGDPSHVVEELAGRIGPEIGAGGLGVGQVRHQGAQIVHPVIDAAKGAGGEAAVAAAQGLRRALQHQHRRALVRRRQGRAKGGVAGADHNHIDRPRRHAAKVPRQARLRSALGPAASTGTLQSRSKAEPNNRSASAMKPSPSAGPAPSVRYLRKSSSRPPGWKLTRSSTGAPEALA
jgi:hypothetical protein